MKPPFAIALLLLARVDPCARSSGNTTTDVNLTDCNALVTALADANGRCGFDAGAAYQVQRIAGGDCKNVTAIRNHDSLQKVCLPSLATISCQDLVDDNFDEECKLQLVQAIPQQ